MKLKDSILATLAYHDIFDYPLTSEEIHKFLIGKRTTKKSVFSSLVILERSLAKGGRSDRISQKDSFYSLKKRQKIFSLRKSRAKYSITKLKRALFYTKLLSLIPTVRFVAVSGALAMENSNKNDDIDLIIVTQKGRIWTTRFLANLILFPFKRKPSHLKTTSYKLQTNNKACLNIFIDESDLKIKNENIYTAHELCQIVPILDREQTYSRLIRSNKWVFKYLPNWQPSSSVILAKSGIYANGKKNYSKPKRGVIYQLLTTNCKLTEFLLKKFQLFYMKKKITTEKVGERQLFFHPSDTQERIIKEYQKRLLSLSHSGANPVKP